MNKQELIKKIKTFDETYGSRYYIAMDDVKNLVEQLDESQKVTVPQFVADWIEECKNDGFHLFGAMEGISLNQKKLDYWFREDDNMELFARAWLDGYTVEEKRYTVKIKAVDQYLVSAKDENFLGFLSSKLRTYFTRKELEDADFGWVFDCPGIEIEEVAE